MCGINGIFAYNSAASSPDPRELVATRDAMERRGPDGFGEWWNADRRVALGHRRLALLDLSDAGAQPMVSPDDRYTVTFNGEIYNYPALRAELEAVGVQFRSRSDTEILLLLYAREGEGMLKRLRGMFAFAIWDNLKNELFLARDPYGIKPLYISNDGWTFRFASQVRALLAGGRVSSAAEPAGVVGFYIWGSVPEPYTLYRDIEALPPGASLLVTRVGPHGARPFASVRDAFMQGSRAPAPQPELAQRVRLGVRESVSAHMLADVPVGVFLSGGVDSVALLALAAELGGRRPCAITLSFSEFAGTENDETKLASSMASSYGADHIVRTVDKAEFLSDLPSILAAMDQPSIDGVNSWFVAKATREIGLKAAVSGVGGDELLAGYESFVDIPHWARRMRVLGKARPLGALSRILMGALGVSRGSPKLRSMVEYGGTYAGAYLLRRGLFLPHELQQNLDAEFVAQGMERLALMRCLEAADPGWSCNPLSRVGALESTWYLRNQLLRDADWAGMAHSVEIRTPLVDHKLLETVAPVVRWMGQGRAGKKALAEAPVRNVPQHIVTNPKKGFGVPISVWATDLKVASRQSRGAASRVWAQQISSQFPGLDQKTVSVA